MKILLDLSPFDIDAAQISAYDMVRILSGNRIPEMNYYGIYIRNNPGHSFLDFLFGNGLEVEEAKRITRDYLRLITENISYVESHFAMTLLMRLKHKHDINVYVNLSAIKYLCLENKEEEIRIISDIKNLFSQYSNYLPVNYSEYGDFRYISEIGEGDDGGVIIFDQHFRIELLQKMRISGLECIYKAGKMDFLAERTIPKNAIYSFGQMAEIVAGEIQ